MFKIEYVRTYPTWRKHLDVISFSDMTFWLVHPDASTRYQPISIQSDDVWRVTCYVNVYLGPWLVIYKILFLESPTGLEHNESSDTATIDTITTLYLEAIEYHLTLWNLIRDNIIITPSQL